MATKTAQVTVAVITEAVKVEIAKLNLGPDDYLVLKTLLTLSSDQIRNIRNSLRNEGFEKTLVVDGTFLDLSVITPVTHEGFAVLSDGECEFLPGTA